MSSVDSLYTKIDKGDALSVQSVKEKHLGLLLHYEKIKWPESFWLRQVNPKNYTARFTVPGKWVEECKLLEREQAAPAILHSPVDLDSFVETAKEEISKGNPILVYIFEEVKPKK